MIKQEWIIFRILDHNFLKQTTKRVFIPYISIEMKK